MPNNTQSKVCWLSCQLALVSTLLAVAIGCGKDNTAGRIAINGQVSYAGTPVKEGSILFRSSDGSAFPESSGPITNGKYSIPLARGPKEGDYFVVIHAYRSVSNGQAYVPSYLEEDQASSSPPEGVPEQFLPKKYNDDSKISVTFSPTQAEYDFALDK